MQSFKTLYGGGRTNYYCYYFSTMRTFVQYCHRQLYDGKINTYYHDFRDIRSRPTRIIRNEEKENNNKKTYALLV